MPKKNMQFLSGFLTGGLISLLLIHFVAAEAVAKIFGVSVPVAYGSLVAILIVWTIVTSIRIIQGRIGHLQQNESQSNRSDNA